MIRKTSENVRNNELLKTPNYIEHITRDEFQFRVNEIKKCKEDVCYFAEKYFYIISLDKGKSLISLYPKQRELLKCIADNNRIITLAARQSSKTTTYSIYALWYTIFFEDVHVLICANTGASATEFCSRIEMAYEMLPMWLKPGIDPKNWNKRKLKFSNGSSISAAPTSPSVRGRSINCIDGKTKVTIKDIKSGKIFKMSMNELEEKMKYNEQLNYKITNTNSSNNNH